ncbi:hypothetical protein [Aeromonas sp. sif2416]|uniref:hypothetical protein n=1 Tax=Aeromonas sp. sif2416 TaxID=2854793 RepID=UPI001C493A17|nr:hypothetical protein [Aeromonas sp. sif2416]MBV7439591.1 hypothetical protein [Aeromonas sp. sif2416]
MAREFPFSYSEYLSESTLQKLPEELKVSAGNASEALIILRLLSGSIKINHIKSQCNFIQNDNYFISNLKGYGQHWKKQFPKLVDDEYSAEQLASYIKSNRYKNRTFYKNILSEISYFFYYQRNGNHSIAFIFLYRLLENISYAFPLTYVSKTDDFKRTYTFLKDIMNGNKDSEELGFFKSFVTKLFYNTPMIESSIDLVISVDTEEEQEHIYSLLKDLCTANMLSERSVEPRMLSIKYTEFGSFIITLRNRFFHYMNGGAKNIESSEISDIDVLFSIINKQSLHWISSILLEIISHNITELHQNNGAVNLQL